jgi:hypothetical protein
MCVILFVKAVKKNEYENEGVVKVGRAAPAQV